MDLARAFILTAILAIVGLGQAGCQSSDPTYPQDGPGFTVSDGKSLNKIIEDYTKLIEQKPDDAEAYFRRGFAYSLKGQYALALNDYSKAIELDPSHAIAHEDRGTIFYRMGKYPQAIQDYTKAIELRPDYGLAYENRAWAYYAMKDYDKALTDIGLCKQYGGKPSPVLMDQLKKASGLYD